MPRIDLEDGEYSVVHDNGSSLHALRYGEPWRDDLVGDGLVLAMAQEIERLRGVVAEVSDWAICACLATPEDMAQNLPRIVEITSL
jgi:hypothetical protein